VERRQAELPWNLRGKIGKGKKRERNSVLQQGRPAFVEKIGSEESGRSQERKLTFRTGCATSPARINGGGWSGVKTGSTKRQEQGKSAAKTSKNMEGGTGMGIVWEGKSGQAGYSPRPLIVAKKEEVS